MAEQNNISRNEFVGLNDVGVLRNSSGEYLCWNRKEAVFYLGKIEDANIILGDKERCSKRIIEMYKKAFPNKDSNMTLEIVTYVNMKDLKDSFILTGSILRQVAWLYEYVTV